MHGMTPTDLTVVCGLIAASLGFLAASLLLLACINRILTIAANAGARHIEECMTRALEIPLYGMPRDNELEEEHAALIKQRR